ncbi:hypothetical protein WA026_007751 [Henosepilachna vigintioctopunctata]|uniref:Protein phosphatase 1 regulatory subunit 21 N-terminal domain-containing protein n=1 Tax=Henosepilachna vigintioctopunctata TaxID=420089 RepID=A0AAW1U310_9CUCU
MDKENPSELEIKYQKLAAEFAKIRSHATVLKKALLEEQAKNSEMKEVLRNHEQQSRKHNQEMDSLLFRNEQLSKRISVLQQELQSSNKKGKQKTNNVSYPPPDMTVVDEELQKKIIENAQLLSSMSDKEIEISDQKERICLLENNLQSVEAALEEMKKKNLDLTATLKKEKNMNKQTTQNDVHSQSSMDSSKDSRDDSEEIKKSKLWQEEAERLKTECDLLRSKPTSNEKLTEYYECKIREMLKSKQMCLSETKTLWAENIALSQRLENLIIEHKELESKLENNKEELNLTTQNYKAQLDAMTEHLAAQNDKITKQSDEIETLMHRLISKK